MIGRVTRAIAIIKAVRNFKEAIATARRIFNFLDSLDDSVNIEQQHIAEVKDNASIDRTATASRD